MDFCDHLGGFECFEADHHAHPSQEEHPTYTVVVVVVVAWGLTSLLEELGMSLNKEINQQDHNTRGLLVVHHDWEGHDGQL